MSEDRPPPSDDFDARLRKARERGAPPASGSEGDGMSRSALGLAFRIGVELVAAMIVGLGGGLLLDRWLGTAPWGLVGMFFLGAAAGIMNVYRTVNGIGMAPGYRRPPDETGGGPQDRTG